MPVPDAQPPRVRSRPAHQWMVLGVVAIVQLMVALDTTVVNIALPAAQAELGFTVGQRQWVVTGYTVAFGSLLLLGGRLGDRYGRRWALLIGLAGFAAASVLGGFAPSFAILVTARVLQGACAALLAPAALALLSNTFQDPAIRGKAFGIFGAIAGSGSAIGLLLGGTLTEYGSWRGCLFVNLVFAVLALTGAVLFVQTAPRGTPVRLDIGGAVTIGCGLVGVTAGLALVEPYGWVDARPLGLFIAGVLCLGMFVALERRVRNPLLPLQIIFDRNRGGAFLVLGFVVSALLAVFLYLTYYLQQTRGYSPLLTGVAFLPMPIGSMLTSTLLTGRLLPRLGARTTIAIGGITSAGGVACLLLTSSDSSYVVTVLPSLTATGAGMGLIFSTAISTATTGVRPDHAGASAAVVSTMQMVGGSIGTALLSTIFVSALAIDPGTAENVAIDGYHAVFRGAAVALLLVAGIAGTIIRPHGRRW